MAAPFATACRVLGRPASRRVVHDAAVRGFRTTAAARAAQNFTMPALSPTMTEGNIATWKVKEGDEFVAGDVLLEIETDKASMDVEAQEDGVVMKIFEADGSKGIQVGKRIGVLAEPGDDISKLELPADESKSAAAPKEEPKKEQPPAQPQPSAPQKQAAEPDDKKATKSSQRAPKLTYPYYPSVEHLIKEHKLDESVVRGIEPTGPQGRLLKGDVLAYLGKASGQRPAEISARFEHNSHLDLSNIKIKPAAPPTDKAVAAEKPKKAEAPPVRGWQVSMPISWAPAIEVQRKLQENLGTHIPLAFFYRHARDAANAELPRPGNYKPSDDELFNQIVGLDRLNPWTSRGDYLPRQNPLPPASFTGVAPKPAPAKVDIIDFLAGTSKTASKPAPPAQPKTETVMSPRFGTFSYTVPADEVETEASTSPRIDTFSLTVPEGEVERARAFLRRFKNYLESDPGRLILLQSDEVGVSARSSSYY